MIEDFLTYLSSEKRYSELTVRAYGDDIRQFVLFCNSLSESVKETAEHASTRCAVPFCPRPTGGVQGCQPQTKPFVAAATEEQVQTIIDKCSEGKFLGIFGEKTVNVLKVNLMLDGILK